MSKHLKGILKELNLSKKNGLYEKGDELPDYPSRIKIPLESIDYDAIFNLDDKPMIIFKEFDSSYDNAKNDIYSFHRSVWNFNETPVLFIVLNDEIQIYNGFLFEKGGNEPLDTLTKNKAISEFSYEKLISGKYWRKNEGVFSKDTRVQDTLIKNLRYARDILNDNGNGIEFSIINNLLGRLIFSRYLIDRGYFPKNFFQKNCNSKDFISLISEKENLYPYFEYLKKKFNGDMFPLSVKEKKQVKNHHLDILSKLFSGHDISSGQTVLFDIYDFSIIPIELVSNIYEVFLNEEAQKKKNAYYTPPFLVDHILNHTLSKKLDKLNNSQIKILDPACGSGIFLVESLRRLIKKEMEIKKKNLSSKELEDIILNNIFGVDIDENAIYISIFSIYITLLDYHKNVNIEKFKFPRLKNINIFKSDFFDTKNEFNNILNGFDGIDLILGNPPWSKEGGEYENYCIKHNIPLAEKQITQAFLVRCKDFAKKDTDLALIVNSKILYNTKGEEYKEFRKYFLEKFAIKKVLELAPLRKKLFKETSGPGVIIFYKIQNEGNTENDIEYISLKPNKLYKLFRYLTVEKFDKKIIPQKCFIKYDWLWKVALYGNINDFLLIKKLKGNKNSIKKVINDNDNLSSGVGVFVGKKGKYNSSDFKNTFLLDIKKYRNIIQRYYIDYSIDSKWQFDYVKRINPELYNPPYVIIKQSPKPKNFRTVAAFSNQKMIFKKSVMAIKGNKQSENVLMNILGLINSKLFTYYVFSTSAALGVERDIMSEDEILSFPFIEDLKISQKARKIGNLYEKVYNSDKLDFNTQQVEVLENELDEYIFNLYGLNDAERDLVSYIDIPIALYNWQDSPFRNPKNEELEDYARIFESFFKHRLKDHQKHFSVEIYQTDYFIAMNFIITNNKLSKPIKFSKDKNMESILNKLGNLSFDEISTNLYQIKDIKGFEKSSFYIIRPKECKNWHRSLARIDLNEFVSAIITKNSYNMGSDYEA